MPNNLSLAPAGLDPALQAVLADTLRLWRGTLEDLQRRAEQSNANGPLRQLLAAAAFTLSAKAITAVENTLRQGRPLDRAEWRRLCAYLEHTSLAYLATLPARLPESLEVQHLILNWALTLATAWRAANPHSGRPKPAASLLPGSPWLSWDNEGDKSAN